MGCDDKECVIRPVQQGPRGARQSLSGPPLFFCLLAVRPAVL